MKKSLDESGPADGLYIRGLTPPALRKLEKRVLLNGLAARGVRLKPLDFEYDEPLDDILKRGKGQHEGGVVVGTSAGGQLATLLGLELGVQVITVSSRRRRGNYPPGNRDSLEKRAKSAPAFSDATDRLEAISLTAAQLRLITDIRPRGGDSVVRESETHLHPDVRLVEVMPGFVAVGGLDHLYGIREGMKEIGRDAESVIVVGREYHQL